MAKVVAVSGGFDPVHVGHMHMFEEAKKLGDELVVIINNDNWLRTKKKFVVMPETERAELIKAFPFVDRVYVTKHEPECEDRSVCSALQEVKPDIFANGGDRFADNIPEVEVCKNLNIQLVFNVGGGKIQSSSDMVKNANEHRITTHRPWGFFKNHETTDIAHIKTLHLYPNSRLSLQKHAHRSEHWMLVSGEAEATFGESKETLTTVSLIPHQMVSVPAGMLHRLQSTQGGVILEVTSGEFDEEDIVRIEDDYGRVL